LKLNIYRFSELRESYAPHPPLPDPNFYFGAREREKEKYGEKQREQRRIGRA